MLPFQFATIRYDDLCLFEVLQALSQIPSPRGETAERNEGIRL